MFELVNPFIQGNKKYFSNKTNPKEAASELYQNISNEFNNAIPNFYFTIKNKKNYHHFKVNENKLGNTVEVSLNKIKVDEQKLNQFTENINKLMSEGIGGGKKDKKYKKIMKKIKN